MSADLAITRDIEYQRHVYRACRMVAKVVINGGPDIEIWYYDAEGVPFFFVTEGDGPVVFETTIRRAFSLACKSGGWG